jgi:hypothetical protein
MQWQGFRIPIVITSLVVGLLLLVGAQWLFNRYNYEQPLEDLMKGSKAVQSYRIDDDRPVIRVQVKFREVNNLAQTYRDLESSLKDVLGAKEFVIELKDNRNPQLEEIYYYSQFAVYEALARGDFINMEQHISRRAASAGATAKVNIDHSAIYVQMEKGDHYLYEIIPVMGTDNGTADASARR